MLEQLGQDLEPSSQASRNCVREADREDGRCTDRLTTTDSEGLRRLRQTASEPVFYWSVAELAVLAVRPVVTSIDR
jgi:hypothetical protein